MVMSLYTLSYYNLSTKDMKLLREYFSYESRPLPQKLDKDLIKEMDIQLFKIYTRKFIGTLTDAEILGLHALFLYAIFFYHIFSKGIV